MKFTGPSVMLYAIALKLALTLTACAPLPPNLAPNVAQNSADRSTDAAASAIAKSEGNAVALAYWWRHFNDPMLSRLISQALAANAGSRGVQATAAEALTDGQIAVAAEAALSYIQVRAMQTHLLIAAEHLASQNQTLQIANWRMQSGLASMRDIEQARIASAENLARIAQLETALTHHQYALSVLTSQAPQVLAAQLGHMHMPPQPADDLAIRIPTKTLRQRPDVRAAEKRICAAMAQSPDPTATPLFQLDGMLGQDSVTQDAIVDSTTALNAQLSGLTGGNGDAPNAGQSALDQAQQAYLSALLAALAEVEDGLASLRGDRERVAWLNIAAKAAATNALLAQYRYAGGLSDFQTVLDSQRNWLLAEDSVASGMAEVSADYVRLYKLLGGGWQSGGAGIDGDGGATALSADPPPALPLPVCQPT